VETDSDILLVYAPGSTPDNWATRMAKFFPPALTMVDVVSDMS